MTPHDEAAILRAISVALKPYLHDMITLDAMQQAPREVVAALARDRFAIVPMFRLAEVVAALTDVAAALSSQKDTP